MDKEHELLALKARKARILNGLVQIDDDKLTFEFVERRATSD